MALRDEMLRFDLKQTIKKNIKSVERQVKLKTFFFF